MVEFYFAHMMMGPVTVAERTSWSAIFSASQLILCS